MCAGFLISRTGLLALTFLLLTVSACRSTIDGDLADSAAESIPTLLIPTAGPTAAPPTPSPTSTTENAGTPEPPPTPEFVAEEVLPTPFFDGETAACGRILPITATYDGSLVTELSPNTAALREIRDLIREEAAPALEYLLNSPENVGLAAYRVGEEESGVYLNGDTPMPLASVVKVLHLIAYAEAVAAGELNPTATVTVEELDHYYLPTLDLRAHSDALAGMEADGRIFGQPPALVLDSVVRMMIEYSSNAATDYVHMILGQETIEESAAAMDLDGQTAPCPFLGQFLVMANHTRAGSNDDAAVRQYIANPGRYAKDVMQFTAAFSQDAQFRQQAIDWRRETRRPNGQTQRLFSENLNAQGTALAYAGLMARLAQNGLSNAESSFNARRHLEWPMRFTANQELFSNLGFKGGALPGILTTVYYAYPKGDTVPIVVALFFRDLDRDTYRAWRRTQAHDEFARWLLSEPEALPALRALLPVAD